MGPLLYRYSSVMIERYNPYYCVIDHNPIGVRGTGIWVQGSGFRV